MSGVNSGFCYFISTFHQEVVSMLTDDGLRGSGDLGPLLLVWDMISSPRFLTALMLAWLATPVLYVFLAGRVLEGRWVPLWEHQARSFFPGDVLLGVVMAAGWYFYEGLSKESFWRSGWLWLAAFVVGFALAYVMHKFVEAPNYEPRALRGPTKLYHDYGLYGVYGPILFMIVIPAIFYTPWSPAKMIAVLAFGAWLYALWWDSEHLTAEDRQKMHPPDWKQPLWVHNLCGLPYRVYARLHT